MNYDLKSSPDMSKAHCVEPAPPSPGQHSRGFTFVELLVAVAFIGILITIALTSFTQYARLAQIARALSDVRTIDKSIAAYLIDKGSLPADLSDLGTVPPDPWGNPYQYYNIQAGGGAPYLDASGVEQLNSDFDLYSKGADGLTAKELTLGGGATSQDDVVRYFNGLKVQLGAKVFSD